MGKWVVDYIQEVPLLLFEITTYRAKTSDYICKLTVIFYLSYLHSAIILNSTPCRFNKSIIYKTPSFLGFRNFWLKNSDVTAGYFVILREHPLRNSNQQPNLPRKKKPKDLKSKSMDWFLYDNDVRHERIKINATNLCNLML